MTDMDLAELMCALRAEVVLAECRALSGDERVFASKLLDEVCSAYVEMHPPAEDTVQRFRTAHRLLIYKLLALRGSGLTPALNAVRTLFDARFLLLLHRLMGERTSPGSRRSL